MLILQEIFKIVHLNIFIMKKIYLLSLTLFCLFLLGLKANAQGPNRSLVITEFMEVHISRAYIELTNMGDVPLTLSDFSCRRVVQYDTGLRWDATTSTLTDRGNFPSFKLPNVILAPGKSWTMMNVRPVLAPDGLPNHVIDYLPKCDWIMHIYGGGETIDAVYKPEWEMYGDSIDPNSRAYLNGLFQGTNGAAGCGFLITNHFMSGAEGSMHKDSAIVDIVNCAYNTNYTQLVGGKDDVAGVAAASITHILVRKSNVKKGSQNWELDKGTSLENSQWIPVPAFGTQSAFTTFGNHGDYQINLESNKMVINKTDTTILVPWGNARRGDDIIHRMTIGDGMSWYYNKNLNSDDSAKVTVCDGDILDIYAVGNERKLMHFKLSSGEPEKTMAKVFPLLSRNILDQWSGPRYSVTDDVPGMDSIVNVPSAERVDTLFKYLEKAPKANWEIQFVDGKKRVDLKDGDILKVTAENGTTIKNYFISVNEYIKNNNTLLSSITWPDIPEYIPGWSGDTIPKFSPNIRSYHVTLPFGTKQVPAFVAKSQNLNAKITQKRATSLSGGLEDRTTRFLVVSESDTLSTEYVVTFDVEKDPAKIQKYVGEPFYTEMTSVVLSAKGGIQVVNPRNIPLDMSRYMFVSAQTSSGVNPALAIQSCITKAPTIANHKARYLSCYVPGYQFTEDAASWILKPGKLSIDPDIDPVVAPLGVFSIATNAGRPVYDIDAVVNKLWYPATDPTVDCAAVLPYFKRKTESLMLFKILNDSILSGTKQIGDPKDFELVDLVGDATIDGAWPIAGVKIINIYRGQMVRKPSVVHGSVIPGDGFGTNADDSQWIVGGYTGGTEGAFGIFGHHTMDPVTLYMSTIASTVYKVSDGYSGFQTIQGDLNATTVQQFYDNIIKADTGQVLSMTRSGNVLGLNDLISDFDKLTVVSKDGTNKTNYLLINKALDNNTSLSLVSLNTGLMLNGKDETVTYFTYDMTLRDLLEKIKAPDLASINVIDTKGNLVPLKILNADTLYVDTKVGSNIIVEVVAQNGVNKKLYKLVTPSLPSDAYLISSMYDVNQNTKFISNIPYGISKDVLFSNIEAVKGGTITLLDKAGFVRTSGTVHTDDILKVISKDGSVYKTYKLTFLTETNPDFDFTKIDELESISKSILSIYPVPARDFMTIKLEDQNVKQFTVSFISLNGTCVYRELVQGDAKKLDVQHFKSGAYVVSVFSNGLIYNKMVLINP